MKEKDACGLNCGVSQLSAIGNLDYFYSLSSCAELHPCIILSSPPVGRGCRKEGTCLGPSK